MSDGSGLRNGSQTELGNHSSRSGSGSGDMDTKMKKSESYQERIKILEDNRLMIARQWVMMVCVYYLARAAFIIFPLFDNADTFKKVFEII